MTAYPQLERLGRLLRALADGQLTRAQAHALIDGDKSKLHRDRQRLGELGFTTQYTDGQLTLSGGPTLTALTRSRSRR